MVFNTARNALWGESASPTAHIRFALLPLLKQFPLAGDVAAAQRVHGFAGDDLVADSALKRDATTWLPISIGATIATGAALGFTIIRRWQ